MNNNAAFVPPNPGLQTTSKCTFAYDASCQTFAADTCNGDDHDTNAGVAGDQDELIPGGSLAICDADWGASAKVFDMTGNAKEWTAQRAAAVNPIRGGGYNNSAAGLTCQNNFLTADDAFQFDNVGFRCCR